MKKLLLLIASLFCASLSLVAPKAHAAITLSAATSSRNGQVGSTNSYTLVGSVNVPSGATLVATCMLFNVAGTSTVTNVSSTGGDTFTKIIEATSSDFVSMWYATSSVANASDKITCTWNNSAASANSHAVTFAVYNGAGGGIEAPSVGSSTSQAIPWRIPSSTTSFAGDVFVAQIEGQLSGTSLSIIPPATNEAQPPSGNGVYADYGLGTTLSAGTYSIAASSTVNPGHWIGGMFALIPTSTPVSSILIDPLILADSF